MSTTTIPFGQRPGAGDSSRVRRTVRLDRGLAAVGIGVRIESRHAPVSERLRACDLVRLSLQFVAALPESDLEPERRDAARWDRRWQPARPARPKERARMFGGRTPWQHRWPDNRRTTGDPERNRIEDAGTSCASGSQILTAPEASCA
jgi:hypothetical protein